MRRKLGGGGILVRNSRRRGGSRVELGGVLEVVRRLEPALDGDSRIEAGLVDWRGRLGEGVVVRGAE